MNDSYALKAFEIVDFSEEPEEDYVEKFDFTSPEDVCFEVVGPHDPNGDLKSWKNYSIEVYNVVHRANPNVTGAALYDMEYGGFFDYTIQGMIEPPGEGWFTMYGITGTYHRGDGWMTDDDMDFNFEGVRPATPEEIAMV